MLTRMRSAVAGRLCCCRYCCALSSELTRYAALVMCGTGAGHAPYCVRANSRPKVKMLLCVRLAVSGTDVAYPATRRAARH
eukprot:701886-Rhodomonas_salina.2